MNGNTHGSLALVPPVVVTFIYINKKLYFINLCIKLPPKVEYPSGQGLPSPKLKGWTTLFVAADSVLSFSQTKPFLLPQFAS